MNRTIATFVVLGALTLTVGGAQAQEYTKGTAYVEPRGGVYGTTNSKVHVMTP